MPLHKVTCVPRGHALGYVRRNPRLYGSMYVNRPFYRLLSCQRMIEHRSATSSILPVSLYRWAVELRKSSVGFFLSFAPEIPLHVLTLQPQFMVKIISRVAPVPTSNKPHGRPTAWLRWLEILQIPECFAYATSPLSALGFFQAWSGVLRYQQR